MPITLISYLVPRNAQQFSVTEDVYIKGGYSSVANVAARDAIPAGSRKAGMLVYTRETGATYRLRDDLATWESQLLRTLRELGPVSGYHEYTPSGPFPDSEIWWTDEAKTHKVLEVNFAYDELKRLTSVIYKAYGPDGDVQETQTENITYDGIFEIGRSRT